MNQSPPSLSEFGVATFQGLFGTVTRLKVGFAAEAALLELGSDFGRSRLVRRRSRGNPINDGLSGIVWFLHGFVLRPREAAGYKQAIVRTSSAAPLARAGMLENRLRGTQAALGAAQADAKWTS